MIMANCCLFNEIGPKSMESIPRINSYKLKTPEMEKIIFVIDVYGCNLNLPILYKFNTFGLFKHLINSFDNCLLTSERLQILKTLEIVNLGSTRRSKMHNQHFSTDIYQPSKPKRLQQINFHSLTPFIDVAKSRMCNFVWFLLKTLSATLSTTVPTWAAYNSLIADRKP